MSKRAEDILKGRGQKWASQWLLSACREKKLLHGEINGASPRPALALQLQPAQVGIGDGAGISSAICGFREFWGIHAKTQRPSYLSMSSEVLWYGIYT
jgi:hypothetical protein